MRILFVAWRDLAHPRAGGSEVVVDALARRLRERGHDVALLCGAPVGERPYEVVANGGTYSQYLRAPLAYRRRFHDVDLVVDVVNGMPFFSPLWRRGPRLAVVTHVHAEQWEKYFPKPVAAAARQVERQGLARAYWNTRFVAISPSTKADLCGMGIEPERVHVVTLGTDVAPVGVAAARSETPLFVALGRLAPNKRLDTLLDLWAKVAPRTGGRLAIVGDGPERMRLEQRVRTDPNLSGVVLEGRVGEERKAQLLGQAWLLVHTAGHEGWGLVIPEAGLCGTPALAYDVPGVRDAVDDGITGVLVRDDDAFAEAWVALADDPERREGLGAAARRRAGALTWDRALDDFLAVARLATSDAARPAQIGPAWRHDPRASGPTRGVRRSVHLVNLFRKEAVDPDRFYHYLAADTVRHLGRYTNPAGLSAVDIGGGPGYTAEALRAAGAHCTVVEYLFDELLLHDRKPDCALQGDGQVLPLRDASVQLVHSSNVLEHVPNWESMLDEMVRVLEPGRGVGYLTFTNWFSPWGGHETSPWHYLGGRRAVERYEKRYGRRPKNEFGVSLYPLHIAMVQRWFRSRPDVEVLWSGPRYLPEWMKAVTRLPGVREIVTWNLVVVFRRRAIADAEPAAAAGSVA